MNDRRRRRILVVARNPKVADRLVAWLVDEYEATLVTSFADAKAHLATGPDLVVSEVKLGEYNGLHLALKAEVMGVPAILIGPADAVLQKDAESVHAAYLTNLTHETFADAIESRLASGTPAVTVLPFRARVTTVAAEAEVMWRAFSKSPSSELLAFGRTMLPN